MISTIPPKRPMVGDIWKRPHDGVRFRWTGMAIGWVKDEF